MAAGRRLKPAGLAGAALLAGLAGLTAVNRAAVRRIARAPDPVEADELSLPADVVEHQFAMSDGCTVRVVERGPRDGPPVVLLHGVTLAAAVWPYQLGALGDAGLRVVALDLRGHGRSGGALVGEGRQAGGGGLVGEGRQAGDGGQAGRAGHESGPEAPLVTLDRMAADVAEVINALDLDDVTLVGHSMGGMVALRMLGADPALAAGHGRLRALVLAGTTANATKGRGFPGLSDLVAAAQPLLASASGFAARLPGPTLPANDLAFLLARITFGELSSARQVAFTGKLTSEVPVRVSAGLMLEIVRFDGEDVLPTIRLPTTVVVGDRDLMTPAVQAEYLADHIAGAELVVLAGCGHMLMLERPDEVNKVILDRAAG